MYHSGDGTTVDQLDVSGLTSDGGTTPINTADVTVTDTNGDGTGDAILTFTGGESITLVGVLSSALDSADELEAIGIPAVPLNYIVEGTTGDDNIVAGYAGDPEGDRVDAGDNLANNNDDLIHAGDGDDTVESGGGNDIVIAGAGDDIVDGEGGDDSLVGGSGHDNLTGRIGNDTLLGGEGDDWLFGEEDDDYVDGGDGNDFITGDQGSDMLIGGSGDDTIFSMFEGDGDDTVVGGETGETTGDVIDYTYMTANHVLTYTGEEAGTITTDTHNLNFVEIESIQLGEGNDTVIGSTGSQNVSTGTGADVVAGGAGDDIFDIGADDGAQDTVVLADDDGNDTISGFEAPVYDPVTDTYTGHDQVDVSGLTDAKGALVNVHDVTVSDDGSGNAVLTFPNGESLTLNQVAPVDLATPAQLAAIGIPMPNFIVDGTAGDDLIDANYIGDPEGDMIDAGDSFGRNDEDRVYAGKGNDTVFGGADNDTINGQAGDDSLHGGSGDDSILGGEGNDVIYGDTSGGSTDELLADGSFEGFKPSLFSQGDSLPDWYSWNNGSPDVSEKGGYEVPWSNTAAPTDGTNYVTLVKSPDDRYGEGISQDLATPLVAGTSYTIKLDAAVGEATNSAPLGEPTFVLIYGNPMAGIVGGEPEGWTTDDIPDGAVLLGSAEITTDFNSGTMETVTITFTPTVDIATLSITLADSEVSEVNNAALILDNISLTEATSDDTLDGGAGDDMIYGGTGDDTFIVSGGNDTIGDFNTGNTGALDDGDQSNNDLVDLSDYYDNIFDLRADQADDGVLNHSNTDVDYSGKVALGGANTLTLTGVDAQDLTFDNTNVTCFTTGTTIRTPDGDRLIETLRVGDLVNTADNGPQPIRWIGMRRLDEKALSAAENLRPVLIDAHVLGNTKPLIVSQQHGMLIEGDKLARAKHLAETLPSVRIMQGKKSVCYVHLMFDTHQIIFAENAATESFYPGPMALKALDQDARAELFTLFPDLQDSMACKAYAQRARPFVGRKALKATTSDLTGNVQSNIRPQGQQHSAIAAE
nr:Hint domain-containing protein [Sulfitobacter undariae]